MATYLVTGGAGFVGCNIVRELVRRKQQVKVLDNLTTGTLDNLSDVRRQAEFIKGDVTSLADVRKACRNVDFVLHQAAVRSIRRSVEQPGITHKVNTTGTLNVLLAAKELGVKRLVFASSSSVYGGAGKTRNSESTAPQPQSPYAVTKLMGEYYCRIFTTLYGLPTVILRYFNVFGPFQNPRAKYAAVIPIFVDRILQHKPLMIEWHGQQSRDFTYVENVVQANLKACTGKHIKFGQPYNIGSGGNTSIKVLAKLLQEMIGHQAKVIHQSKRPGDISKTHASISRARRDLGYSPVVSFTDGLARYVDWYQKNVIR
jgi:nucleoside-diphosphate-sugar epimerase